MVKSIIYTVAAILACLGLFIGVEIYMNKQFDEFHGALEILYKKVEDKTANREDGYAVKSLWTDKKANCISLFLTTIFLILTIGSVKPADLSTAKNTTWLSVS